MWRLTLLMWLVGVGEPLKPATETYYPRPITEYQDCLDMGRKYVGEMKKQKGIYRGFRCEVIR